jgi:hypothetical protein
LGLRVTDVVLRSVAQRRTDMGRPSIILAYVLPMVAVIVGVDVLFFKHHLWLRLMANVGVVLIFAAFYLRFVKHP